jgi:NAD-dependent dihydropyrimidine dehydrogenase PreA subunit
VDYENLAQAGSMMGSGGMVVMDEDTCMVDVARYFVDFLRDESCGKCVPCRLGTRQMQAILHRVTAGDGTPEDLQLLEEIGGVVAESSLCGLGQTAPNPVLSTMRYFRDEYEAHVNESTCPAGVCTGLVTFEIIPEDCICCGRCAENCPVDCISGEKGKPPARATEEDKEAGRAGEPFEVNDEACIRCGVCFESCPVNAVVRR